MIDPHHFSVTDRVFDLSIKFHTSKRRVLGLGLIISGNETLIRTKNDEIGSAAWGDAVSYTHLYLAQTILMQEKGYVTVTGNPEGGSCFSVFLLNEKNAV